MRHGTNSSYVTGCHCEFCSAAHRAYGREYEARSGRRRRRDVVTDEARRNMFSDLLHELFPDGMTDDCPRRKEAA